MGVPWRYFTCHCWDSLVSSRFISFDCISYFCLIGNFDRTTIQQQIDFRKNLKSHENLTNFLGCFIGGKKSMHVHYCVYVHRTCVLYEFWVILFTVLELQWFVPCPLHTHKYTNTYSCAALCAMAWGGCPFQWSWLLSWAGMGASYPSWRRRAEPSTWTQIQLGIN